MLVLLDGQMSDIGWSDTRRCLWLDGWIVGWWEGRIKDFSGERLVGGSDAHRVGLSDGRVVGVSKGRMVRRPDARMPGCSEIRSDARMLGSWSSALMVRWSGSPDIE